MSTLLIVPLAAGAMLTVVVSIVALLGCSFWKRKHLSVNVGEDGKCPVYLDKDQYSSAVTSHRLHTVSHLSCETTPVHPNHPDSNRCATLNRELPQIPGNDQWRPLCSSEPVGDTAAISEQTSQLYAVVGELSAAENGVSVTNTGSDSADGALRSFSDAVTSRRSSSTSSCTGYQTISKDGSNDRALNCSTNGEDNGDNGRTIPARLAVSGCVAASVELPYMTPPPLATTAATSTLTSTPSTATTVPVRGSGCSNSCANNSIAAASVAVYFSGDSVQSADSRGYTRITVREPAAELCLRQPHVPRSSGSSTCQTRDHASLDSANSAAVERGVSAVATGVDLLSESNLYSAVGEPAFFNTIHNSAALSSAGSGETPRGDGGDDGDEDEMYEAIPDTRLQPSNTLSVSFGQRSLVDETSPTAFPSPGNTSATGACSSTSHSSSVAGVNNSLHSRQVSSSSAVLSHTTPPVADRQLTRSPLPPLPSAEQLDKLYAKVVKPGKSAGGDSCRTVVNSPPPPPERRPPINISEMEAIGETVSSSSASLLHLPSARSPRGVSQGNAPASVSGFAASAEPNYECIDSAGCGRQPMFNEDELEDDEDESSVNRYARIVRPSDKPTHRSRHLYERVRRSGGAAYDPPYESINSAVDGDDCGSSGGGYACIRSVRESAGPAVGGSTVVGSDTEELYSSIVEPPYASVMRDTAVVTRAQGNLQGRQNAETVVSNGAAHSPSLSSQVANSGTSANVAHLYAKVQKRRQSARQTASLSAVDDIGAETLIVDETDADVTQRGSSIVSVLCTQSVEHNNNSNTEKKGSDSRTQLEMREDQVFYF